MNKRLFIYFSLVAIILSCKINTENTDFEKNVLLEILPSIVDSTCGDPRLFGQPRLGEYVKRNNRLVLETSLATIEQKLKYKVWLVKRDSIKKDTTSIYLAFNPIIKPSGDDLDAELERCLKRKKNIIADTNSYALDLDKIKLNQHFKFKHDSLFYKDYRVWMKKYDFIFSGFFEVSRILFDESKTY